MTLSDLFSVIVGEGGIQPEYFYHRLTFNEAGLIIDGISRRYRATMEGARLIHGCIGGLFAKNYKLPIFPWDDEFKDEPKEYSEAEISAMREEALAFEKTLNTKQKK